ncbi:MAG: DEAD/DEAH box helicase family protein, partial [Chloroflexota bacterium]
MQYVRVTVNISAISGEFDYHLPPELEGRIAVGHLVRVPFGNQVVQGVVLQLLAQPGISYTKAVQDLLDLAPVLTPVQIELARQISVYTLNSLASVIDLMLPPGLSQHADVLYILTSRGVDQKARSFTEVQTRLITLIGGRGPLRGRQIDRHFVRVEWRKAAQALQKQGLIESQSILPPPSVRPKYILTAQLAVSPEQAQAAMPSLGKTPATLERRRKALQFLINEPEAVAVSWVYAESGCNLSDLQELAERELIVLLECEIFRDPLRKFDADQDSSQRLRSADLQLTTEQEQVLSEVIKDFQPRLFTDDEPKQPFLLYGVTGSGKTEIYLKATTEAIRRGKSVIILVP